MASKFLKNLFHNKIVWITGVASGIGEALMWQLAQTTATVVVIDKQKPNVLPPNAHLYLFDLSCGQQRENNMQVILKKYPSIDYLFLCAGVSQRSKFLQTNIKIDRMIMEINYFANVHITKIIMPIMIEQQQGHIIAISSLMGKFSSPLRSSYCASKHALHGFFESLRIEIGNNIHITMVCPGFIKTNISYNALDEHGQPQQKHDMQTNKGMPASQCADKIIRAVAKKKKEVLVGKSETLLVHLKHFFPKIFDFIIKSSQVT